MLLATQVPRNDIRNPGCFTTTHMCLSLDNIGFLNSHRAWTPECLIELLPIWNPHVAPFPRAVYVSCSMKPQLKLPWGPMVKNIHSSGADSLSSIRSSFLCSQGRLPRKIFNKEFSDWETIWEGLVLVCFMLLLQNTTDWRVNKRNSFLLFLEARKSNIMQVWHRTDSESMRILLHQHSVPEDSDW